MLIYSKLHSPKCKCGLSAKIKIQKEPLNIKCMKIIYNKWIPFKGFSAMNILGFLFTKVKPDELKIKTLRHEQIHTMQQYEIHRASP